MRALIVLTVSSCVLSACGTARRALGSHARRGEGFSVLSEPPSPDESLSPQVAEALAQSTQPEFSSADIGAARRLLPEEPVWLLPAANNELCIARLVYPLVARARGTPLPPAAAIACDTQAAALAGKLVVTQSLATTARAAPGPTRVLGVLPDGARNIWVSLEDGKRVSVEVMRNGYELVVNGPERLQFRIRRGGRTVTETVHLVTSSVSGAPTQQRGGAL